MNENLKIKITEELAKRISSTNDSQNRISKKIGISGATVNAIVNNQWQQNEKLVSIEMWNKISAYLGIQDDWIIVEDDSNFKRISRISHDAQSKSQARAISAGPGMGKSQSLQAYAQRNENVFYVECGEYWSKKVFLDKIKQAMGLPIYTQPITERVEEITTNLRKLTKPLIIIDEADKLKDNIIQFFITFYNETSKRCGFILSGSVFFEKRIEKGVRLNRQGYCEIFSRLGGEFLHLHELDQQRVSAICNANGIVEAMQVKEIYNSSNTLFGIDLRTIKRKVEDQKIKNAKQIS